MYWKGGVAGVWIGLEYGNLHSHSCHLLVTNGRSFSPHSTIVLFTFMISASINLKFFFFCQGIIKSGRFGHVGEETR